MSRRPTTVTAAGSACGSIEELDESPRGGLSIARFEQLGELVPVDCASIEPQAYPSAVTVVGRRDKAHVLCERGPLRGIREQMDRST